MSNFIVSEVAQHPNLWHVRSDVCHRPSSTVRDRSLLEWPSWLAGWVDPVAELFHFSTKTGLWGGGMSSISRLSIERTVWMVGLSLANSCTHNSPIWMHRIISTSIFELAILWSAKAKTLFSLHNFQAWNLAKPLCC